MDDNQIAALALLAMVYVYGMAMVWPYVWKGMEESRQKYPDNFSFVVVVIVCACICVTWPFWATLGLLHRCKRGD